MSPTLQQQWLDAMADLRRAIDAHPDGAEILRTPLRNPALIQRLNDLEKVYLVPTAAATSIPAEPTIPRSTP